jgi:uncharacterized membrane protein
MKYIIRRIITIFVIVAAIDLLIGLLLLLTENGSNFWSVVNLPVFYAFPFNYLIVCTYEEALYLWPLHAGLLAVLVYLVFKGVKSLTYNKAI